MLKRASILETFDLTPVQRSALEARGRDVVLIAGAGSGKTRTLTARYLSLLEEGLAPRSVVAVTFTEKAAREMRNRIRTRVNAWVRDARSGTERARWAAIEADIDTARIGTIHSLCAEIIRAHPVEAAVDPGFEVLEEGLAAAWKSQAVEDALTWASGEADLVPVLRAFTPMQLRAGLAKLIGFRLESAEAFDGVNLVARWDDALNARVREFAEGSEAVDAIRRLEELETEGRLEADAGPKLNEQVQLLLAEWHAMGEALARSSLTEAVGHLARIREECLNLTVGRKAGQAKPLVRLIRDRYEAQVERWLGRVKDVQALENAEGSLRALVPGLRALFAKAAEFYRRAREQKHALDFDDLEDGAARLLDRDDVRRRWRGEIRAVLVDEFQDTNARQRRIVEALSGSRDEEHGGLFVVGDAKQSIYRFRGADVTVFVEVEQAAAKAGGEVLHLAETFRAHAGLVDVLNGLLAPAMSSALPRRPYQVPYERLEARRSEPRAETRPPFVEMIFAEGGEAEASRRLAAAVLAHRLSELARAGVPWDDMALLFRASTSFPDFERALEDAGIPFVTVAGRGFYDRPEIRDLLNLLRAVANPWDDLAMAGLLRSPAFGLSDAALYQLRRPIAEGEPVSFKHALRGDLSALGETDRPRAERARAALDRLAPRANRISVAELLKDLLDSTRLGAALRAAPSGERLQRNVDKLLQDAHASGIARVEDFLDYIETLKAAGAREGEAPSEAQGAVRLMTVHKAKGLEFPVVVLADASRQAPNDYARIILSRELGVVARPGRRTDEEPVSYRLAKAMEREEEQAEEQRLLYVGATRAQERLIVIGYRGGQRGSSWFSQLVEALPEESASEAGAATEPVLRLPDTGGLIALRTVRDLPSPVRQPASVHPLPREEAALTPLYQVVPEHEFEISDDKLPFLEAARKRRQDIFAAHAREGARLVGNLVHLAIRRGCFQGDVRLGAMLGAAVREAGVLDEAEAGQHIAHVERLLERLRGDPHWAAFERARRYHEVPFSVSKGEGVSSGYIDMLVEDGPQAWQVVDFKTTRIETESELERLMQTDFLPQLARYREAVERQLGGTVQTRVCLLDFQGRLEWRPRP
ncbi:MAG TPA: UvrD-helicase domain-containing protein [Anaerolineales bacterium]|nr:UvrD-helicase domain-containing protein [Anaerolineales bacterium]